MFDRTTAIPILYYIPDRKHPTLTKIIRKHMPIAGTLISDTMTSYVRPVSLLHQHNLAQPSREVLLRVYQQRSPYFPRDEEAYLSLPPDVCAGGKGGPVYPFIYGAEHCKEGLLLPLYAQGNEGLL